jgi:hypothetical protein
MSAAGSTGRPEMIHVSLASPRTPLATQQEAAERVDAALQAVLNRRASNGELPENGSKRPLPVCCQQKKYKSFSYLGHVAEW